MQYLAHTLNTKHAVNKRKYHDFPQFQYKQQPAVIDMEVSKVIQKKAENKFFNTKQNQLSFGIQNNNTKKKEKLKINGNYCCCRYCNRMTCLNYF